MIIVVNHKCTCALFTTINVQNNKFVSLYLSTTTAAQKNESCTLNAAWRKERSGEVYQEVSEQKIVRRNTEQTGVLWMNCLRVTAFWQLFSAVNWGTLAMLSELKTSVQIHYMIASMVSDIEADQNDAGQMMWRTGLVYRFQSASRWLETEQHGDFLCRHHWYSVFKNEKKNSNINKTRIAQSVH